MLHRIYHENDLVKLLFCNSISAGCILLCYFDVNYLSGFLQFFTDKRVNLNFALSDRASEVFFSNFTGHFKKTSGTISVFQNPQLSYEEISDFYSNPIYMQLKIGESINFDNFKFTLIKFGYEMTDNINSKFSFSCHGDVVNISMADSELYYKIFLKFDEIEKISLHKVGAQVASSFLTELNIYRAAI